MVILKTTDFIGFYNIVQDPEAAITLQNYIDKYETKYIYKILGSILGKTMIDDCTNGSGTPTDAKDTVLFNPININDPNSNKLYQSEGLKNILMAMIWFEFVTTIQYRQSLIGWVNTQADTANKLSYDNVYRVAEQKWNECLEWIYCIQWYCLWYLPNDYGNVSTKYYFQGQAIEAESGDFL